MYGKLVLEVSGWSTAAHPAQTMGMPSMRVHNCRATTGNAAASRVFAARGGRQRRRWGHATGDSEGAGFGIPLRCPLPVEEGKHEGLCAVGCQGSHPCGWFMPAWRLQEGRDEGFPPLWVVYTDC
jgi:hypothetical protein